MTNIRYFTDPSSLFVSLDQNSYLIYDHNLAHLRPFFKFKLILPVATSEDHKSIDLVLELTEMLISNNFTRGDTLVLLGGGLLLDLGGFLASILYRGVNVVYIPTTLLSMVDACYGGKTAINFLKIKNVLGTFKEPQEILICHDFLTSLDKANYLAGFGEVLKYYFLSGFTFPYRDPLPTIIKESLSLKKQYVDSDLYDTNLRQMLNFGHTFGHIYELKYNLLHGISVIAGIRSILELQRDLKFIEKEEYDSYIEKLEEFLTYFDLEVPYFNYKEHISFLTTDKKNFQNVLNFIFIKSNKPLIQKIPLGELHVLSCE